MAGVTPLLSVPTAWRLAGGSGDPSLLGKSRGQGLVAAAEKARAALAVGEGQESLAGGTGLSARDPRPAAQPATLPVWPADGGTFPPGRPWLLHQREGSPGKIPNQTQVLPGSGGERCLSLCFGKWGLGWLPWQHGTEHPPPQHAAPEDLGVGGDNRPTPPMPHHLALPARGGSMRPRGEWPLCFWAHGAGGAGRGAHKGLSQAPFQRA